MKKHPSALVDISDPTSAAPVSAGTAARALAQFGAKPTVLALDLEATLISSAVSQFPRPLLFEFLRRCRELFPRIVMFTTIDEERFRRIAQTLVEEGSAPAWFEQLEHVAWTGPTKDLAFIPGCAVEDVVLVDDLAVYIHPGQEASWVQVEPFEPPFDGSDRGLTKVLKELEKRVRPAAHSGK
jgi:hypothetical protein